MLSEIRKQRNLDRAKAHRERLYAQQAQAQAEVQAQQLSETMPPYDLRDAKQRQSCLRFPQSTTLPVNKPHVHASGKNMAPDAVVASSSDPYASLPFNSLTSQEQEEIPLAVPVAMLFGRMIKKKADIWVYLAKTTPTIIFHSYYLDGKPDGYQIVDEVLQKAVPSPAFSLATNPMKLLTLATYYFIEKGLARNYELALNSEQASTLESMCDVAREESVQPCALAQETAIVKVRVANTGSPQETNKRQKESDASQMTEPTSIDRYLHLESQDHALTKRLDDHDSRIDALRKKLAEVRTQLEKEEVEAATLITQKDKGETEKKRLWDAMSKEDVRELGRRDIKKRQKF